MKKVFDQTVRDLKREVNKKVLKVPGIEQKILDATSNEPWGPHGSNLSDIAQATRNYHEYQIIMSIIWKRINDTGKNWRHVYKGLTVLEYLVAHGSERVIDEIKEHSYQISTLSDFQYIDSSGRDQGSNVRKKSQSLVALVNDKERIHEVRQKALTNRDKYRSTFSTGGMSRPSSYSSTGGYGDRYDDDRYEGRYGSKDEDRNGYGRERDYRDDDRYGRGGDSYSRDGERYGRESEERYGRESYRDDDYRANRGNDDHQFRSRNRSLDPDRNRSFDDDDRFSSRSGGGRGDDPSYDERRLERKLSEQSVGAPPSYEDAIRDPRNHVQDERDGGTPAAPTLKPPSPPVPKSSSPSKSSSQTPGVAASAMPSPFKEVDSFDEFDPRGSASVVPLATSSSEMDLFGTLSAADSLNSLALIPVVSSGVGSEADMPNNSDPGANFVALSSAPTVFSQPAKDPFGDSPFKATPQDNVPTQLHNVSPVASFQVSTSPFSASGHLPPVATKGETISSFDFGDSFPTSAPSHMPNGQLPSATPALLSPEFPSAQVHSDALGAVPPNFIGQAGLSAPLASQAAPSNPFAQLGLSIPVASQAAAPTNTFSQSGPSPYVASQVAPLNPISQAVPSAPQGVSPTPFNQSAMSTQLALQAAASSCPAKALQPKDKFETKSTVWADTLNRGLVNLNISGPKINPLADIGIDFDQINRMEKRKEKEKSSAVTPVSTITMGKAMGSGSGIGRAGAGGLASAPNPMMGSGAGMGMGGTGGMGMGGYGGMGMGGYGGGMNQQPMGMGMGMIQGAPMRPANGMAPNPSMPGVGYNPMMGMGGYGPPQQPYGGYR